MDTKALPSFMQSLQRSYTGFHNDRYDRVGQLWQGRYKIKLIEDQKYLEDCITYIENNPARSKNIKSLNRYRFSSFFERTGGSTVNKNYSLIDFH